MLEVSAVMQCNNIILTPSLEQRFWQYVPDRPEVGCWHWRGIPCDRYGVIWGGKPNTVKQFVSHRVSWTIHFGPIPEGKQVLHGCDNKSCVRPDHFYLGDHLQNMRDAWARGRCERVRHRDFSFQNGERNHRARLTEQQVRDIRERYKAGGVSQRELGKEYGVEQAHISGIVLGKFWGWLEP